MAHVQLSELKTTLLKLSAGGLLTVITSTFVPHISHTRRTADTSY
jgi:hypothetical protein